MFQIFGHFSFIKKQIYTCIIYSKTSLKGPLNKKTKIGLQDCESLNTGQRIAECSKRSFCDVKLPFGFKTLGFSIFE